MENYKRMKVFIDYPNMQCWEECYLWVDNHIVYAKICDDKKRRKWEELWTKYNEKNLDKP